MRTDFRPEIQQFNKIPSEVDMYAWYGAAHVPQPAKKLTWVKTGG